MLNYWFKFLWFIKLFITPGKESSSAHKMSASKGGINFSSAIPAPLAWYLAEPVFADQESISGRYDNPFFVPARQAT